MRERSAAKPNGAAEESPNESTMKTSPPPPNLSAVALREGGSGIPNSRIDPYAAPLHRRIDALLLLFCIGLCATLLTSAYAKRNSSSSSPSDEVAAATAYAKHRSASQSSANESDRAVTLVSGK